MGNIELSEVGDTGFLKAQRSHKTGEAKWKDIEDLINRWAKRNPRGAMDNEQWIKDAKAIQTDKLYAKADNHGMGDGRFGISIHPELMSYIEAFYPKFLTTKDEMHEFMRRFPKFTVPDRV